MNLISRIWKTFLVLVPLVIIATLFVSSNWRDIDRIINKAHSAVAAGDSLEASNAFAQAAGLSNGQADLWEQAGIHALKAGEHRAAETYFDRAASTSDLSPQALIGLGDIAFHDSDRLLAVDYWDEALTHESDFDLHFRLADSYYELGDLENAILHQKALVEFDPTDSSTNHQLGLMLAAYDPKAAPAYLELAADIEPDLTTEVNPLIRSIRSSQRSDDPAYAYVSAGQSLASMEEWTLAEFALSKATQLNPDFSESWAYLGEAKQQVGEDGFADLEKALQIDPDSIAGNTLMALYWQRQEKFPLALIYLHAAAKIDDRNPALQAEIGNTLALMGNLSSAESHYQRAVDLAPTDPTYWQLLANYHIRHESDLREGGLTAARQAVILAPEDPASLDALAQIYLLMDSHHIARRFLDRALTADNSYAPAHLHLGLVYIIEGNTLKAFQQFTLAKELAAPGSATSDLADRLLETHFP